MALNITTIQPASIKAKNVATEEYVDTEIDSLTKVEDISWQSQVQAAINNNSTYIDGGKIVTGVVNTARLNVNDIMSKDITFTGKITGGAGGLGGIIKSYNSKMTIDLVNGSIYIA